MSTASRNCCLLSVHAALFCQSQTEPLIFILHRSCQARSVTPRSLNDELRVESQVSPCELFGRQSGTETSSFRVLLPCQYHSTNAPSHLDVNTILSEGPAVKPVNALPVTATRGLQATVLLSCVSGVPDRRSTTSAEHDDSSACGPSCSDNKYCPKLPKST
jgi:hypothetical protein